MLLPLEYEHLNLQKLTYLTGSHMYGLNTPTSDKDYTHIYFDLHSHIAVFGDVNYPESESWTDEGEINWKGEDTKLYSLRRFAEMLYKGNPNAVEIVYSEPEINISSRPEPLVISRFMDTVRHHVITDTSLSQYRGHVRGVSMQWETYLKWLANPHNFKANWSPTIPDCKRISHALRLVYCLRGILTTGGMWMLRDHKDERETVLACKLADESIESRQFWMNCLLQLDTANGELLEQKRKYFPTAQSLADEINKFFVQEILAR